MIEGLVWSISRGGGEELNRRKQRQRRRMNRSDCVFSQGLGSGLSHPRTAGFDDGVDDDQELSHTSSDDDLEGFSVLSQSIGESSDDGIAPPGGNGSHVEHGANGFASAADGTFAFHGAA